MWWLQLLVVLMGSCPGGAFAPRGGMGRQPISTAIVAPGEWSPGIDCFSSRSIRKETFPNIDYAFYGYNLFEGYPLTYGRDPGYTHKVFEAFYGDRDFFRQSSDCRFMEPHGYDWVEAVTCSTDFSSEMVSTEDQFKTMLSKSVSASASASYGAGGAGSASASFSASHAYKEAKDDLAIKEQKKEYSTASCDYYYGVMNPRDPPPLTKDTKEMLHEILGKVSEMEKDANSQTGMRIETEKLIYEFLEIYGTHIVTEMKLGAKYVVEKTWTKDDYTSLSNSGTDIAASASASGGYGGFSASASASMSHSTSNEQKSRTINEKSTIKTFSVGSAPPSNGDAMQWASRIKDTPVPTKINLKPITFILRSTLLGKEHGRHIELLRGMFNEQIIVMCRALVSQGGGTVAAQCDLLGLGLN